MRRRVAALVMALLVSLLNFPAYAASEHHGKVTFNGLPVPGATVTATRNGTHRVAITDQQGAYAFTDLDDGAWKFQVEMLGFATQMQDVTVAADAPGPMWELQLLSFQEITGVAPPVATAEAEAPSAPATKGSPAAAAPAPAASKGGGFQRAAVSSTGNAPQQASAGGAGAPRPETLVRRTTVTSANETLQRSLRSAPPRKDSSSTAA